MKKLFLILTLLTVTFIGHSQNILVDITANGSVGIDSVGVGDVQYTYYYVTSEAIGTQNGWIHPKGTKAKKAITDYSIQYVLLGGAHSLVTNTDSLLMSLEGSVDNIHWFHIDLGTPDVQATGTSVVTYLYTASRFAVKDLTAYALYKPTTGTIAYPYYRVKCIHMKVTGNIYPQARVVLKHI